MTELDEEMLTECFIDHEVRLRVQEKIARDIHNLLKWILGTAIGAITIPILLRYLD